MNQNSVIEILFGMQGIGLLLNVFLGFIALIYFVFAALVLRQVRLLNKGFNTDAAPLLNTLAFFHLLAISFLVVFVLLTFMV